MIRPPPGGTPAHSVRTSAPHADRNTNRISRGRIGRNTKAGAGAAVGAAAELAVAAVAGAPAGVTVPPPAALTAFSQLPETFDFSFPDIAALPRPRSARRRRPFDSRSGTRCGSRRPAHWSAFWPLCLRLPWGPAEPRSPWPAWPSPWPTPPWAQRRAQTRPWVARRRERSQPWARPGSLPREPRSGMTATGSTGFAAGIAATPFRPAGCWSNGLDNPSGMRTGSRCVVHRSAPAKMPASQAPAGRLRLAPKAPPHGPTP